MHILRENIAKAMRFNTIQRSKRQKQLVQMTLNVIVFIIQSVTDLHGSYIKALTSPLPRREVAHGPEVSVDLFFRKRAQVYNNTCFGRFIMRQTTFVLLYRLFQ